MLLRIGFAGPYSLLHAGEPVSYTHLDVYKRQVCHSHRSAQGCEIPGEDGQTPVEVDKVVGDAPGNAGQVDNQAAEQQTVGEGSEQEKGSADADVVGEGDSQACLLYTSRCV